MPDLRFCIEALTTGSQFARNAEETKSRGCYPFSDSPQVANSQVQHLSPAVLPVLQKAATAADERKIETISHL